MGGAAQGRVLEGGEAERETKKRWAMVAKRSEEGLRAMPTMGGVQLA